MKSTSTSSEEFEMTDWQLDFLELILVYCIAVVLNVNFFFDVTLFYLSIILLEMIVFFPFDLHEVNIFCFK